jgi:hypothetical protein
VIASGQCAQAERQRTDEAAEVISMVAQEGGQAERISDVVAQ